MVTVTGALICLDDGQTGQEPGNGGLQGIARHLRGRAGVALPDPCTCKGEQTAGSRIFRRDGSGFLPNQHSLAQSAARVVLQSSLDQLASLA